MKYMIQNEWILLDKNFQVSNPDVLKFYDDIHSFTTNIVLKLKLPKIAAKQNAGGHMESQSCLSTAMVFFHKYFLFKKVFSHDYTKYLTCCTCVFLSLKVSNLMVPLEKLIDTFLFLYFRENYQKLSINEKLISEISSKIFQIEFEILNAIGFDLNVDLPYKYIYLMKPYFEESFPTQFYSKYILIVTSFINDSFKLPVCLFYEPLLIFLACVYLVEIYFKIQLKDKADKKWFQLIDASVEFKEIEEISAKIKMIYDYSNSNMHSTHSSSGSLNLFVAPKGAGEKMKDHKRFVIDFDPVEDTDQFCNVQEGTEDLSKTHKGSEQKGKEVEVDLDMQMGLDKNESDESVEYQRSQLEVEFENNCVNNDIDMNENVIGTHNDKDILINNSNKNFQSFGQAGENKSHKEHANGNLGFNRNPNSNCFINNGDYAYENATSSSQENNIDFSQNNTNTNKNISSREDQGKYTFMNPKITLNENEENKNNYCISKKDCTSTIFFNKYENANKNNTVLFNVELKQNKNELSFVYNTYDKIQPSDLDNNYSAYSSNANKTSKPFQNKDYGNNHNNNSSTCNIKNKIFKQNFDKEFLFKPNSNYPSDFSKMKSEDQLKI